MGAGQKQEPGTQPESLMLVEGIQKLHSSSTVPILSWIRNGVEIEIQELHMGREHPK